MNVSNIIAILSLPLDAPELEQAVRQASQEGVDLAVELMNRERRILEERAEAIQTRMHDIEREQGWGPSGPPSES